MPGSVKGDIASSFSGSGSGSGTNREPDTSKSNRMWRANKGPGEGSGVPGGAKNQARGRDMIDKGTEENSSLSSSCSIFWSPSEAKDGSVACLVGGKKGLEPLTAITASIRQQESLSHQLAAMTLNSSSDPLWYSDSGASNHVTDKPENLLGMIPYRGNCMVYTGDGSPLPISHIGTASISTTLGKLSVPGSKSQELLSVSQFTKDFKCKFEFTRCEGPKGRMIARGRKHGELYVLEDDKVFAFLAAAKARISGKKVSAFLWHHRLGHAN